MKRLWKKVKPKGSTYSIPSISSKSIRLLSWDEEDDTRRDGYSPGRPRNRKYKRGNSGVGTHQQLQDSQAAAVSYQYAMHEYEQTVEPRLSNDDGKSAEYNQRFNRSSSNQATGDLLDAAFPPNPSRSFAESSCASTIDEEIYNFDTELGKNVVNEPESCESTNYMASILSSFILYEESYGESYVGETIRYIYPNGYQSMRPGSGPWKLSIIVFLFFVWLSVFIVGHCSDISEAEDLAVDDGEEDQIEMRWCGSQLLYSAWFLSVVVTGVAFAYCSIIGYIKMRDFAVANDRSQPAGIEGRNEFYVQVVGRDKASPTTISRKLTENDELYGQTYQDTSIYQSDGNPQFLGHMIQRPNQAAISAPNR